MKKGKLNDLRGKWVLVTGAGSGIGRATAIAFARRGAHLILVDIDAAPLVPVRDLVLSQGGCCEMHTVDVSDEAAMRGLAKRVQMELGALDVLVNNAGIGWLGPFLDSPLSAWHRSLDINVMGVVHGCSFFLPGMHAAGGARRIVNVASIAGVAPAPNMSAYAASKFAIVGLTESLSIELRLRASQVGFTTVCPGIIKTAITQSRANVSPAISDAQFGKLQAFYEAKGASPDLVAEAIVDGVRRGRELVLVGPYAGPIYHLRRISRALVRWILLNDARKMGYS